MILLTSNQGMTANESSAMKNLIGSHLKESFKRQSRDINKETYTLSLPWLKLLLTVPLLIALNTTGKASETGQVETAEPKEENTRLEIMLSSSDGLSSERNPNSYNTSQEDKPKSYGSAALNQTKPNAIEIKYGKFAWGHYSPITNSSNSSSCTALTMCSEKGLFGDIFTAKYIRRLYNAGLNAIDIDSSVYVARQSLLQSSSGYKVEPNWGENQSFAMITLVPTYRLNIPGTNKTASIGLGAGINIALGSVPYEQPYDIPLNSQLNIEVAIAPLKDKTLQITASLEHRCSFFGLLNTTDGTWTGSQWYNIGVRRWF